MTAYAASPEHEIEQLHCFRTWAIEKIGAQEIETLALRQQLNQLSETVSVVSEDKVQRESCRDKTISSPLTPINVPCIGGKTDCSPKGQTERTVRFNDDAVETLGCEKKTGGLGSSGPSANARPCTVPAQPSNFVLTLDETATQSPPQCPKYYQLSGRVAELSDAEEEDEEDGKDRPPSPQE